MIVISIDPGGTTGVAICDFSVTERGEWEWMELTGDHHMELWELLINHDPDVVVYERFNYQRRDITEGVSLVLDSVEYIGIIKLAKRRCAYWGNTDFELVEQQPSVRTWWTNDRLRKLSLWRSSEHERDATRHLLRYMTHVRGHREFLNLLK